VKAGTRRGHCYKMGKNPILWGGSFGGPGRGNLEWRVPKHGTTGPRLQKGQEVRSSSRGGYGVREAVGLILRQMESVVWEIKGREYVGSAWGEKPLRGCQGIRDLEKRNRSPHGKNRSNLGD